MLKKSIAVVFAIALAMTATVASAQDCTVAAYGDPEGTQSLLDPKVNEDLRFSFYTVMFTNLPAAAVAYKVNIQDLNSEVFIFANFQGPDGGGLQIDEGALGKNVALGECVIGFGGNPILVEEYVLQALPTWQGGTVTISEHVTQALPEYPNLPVYVTCSDVKYPCWPGAALTINQPIDNEATSFGSIKSLYN